MEDIALGSAIISMITVIIIAIQTHHVKSQVRVMKKSFEADHERKKKQSTVEHFLNVKETYTPIYNEIEKIFEYGNAINPKDLKGLGDNEKKIEKKIEFLLALVEHFSSGVNSKVYCIHMVENMTGKHFENMFDKFKPLIQDWRNKHNYPDMYKELEEMVHEINSIRKERSNLSANDAAIKHSN